MKRKILYIFICVALSLPADVWAISETFMPLMEQPQMEDVRISVLNGRNIRIQNASGATMEIYNITGVKVAAFKIEGNDKTICPNLSRGCYIVKVGKVARKISIL